MNAMPRLQCPQWFDSLPSTNAWLKAELERGAAIAPGAVIVAREQTAGRGRKDRPWLSGVGNLAFSLYLTSARPLAEVPSLSMAAAAAVALWLDMYGSHALLKWPNDVLVDGKKISGILAELVACKSEDKHVILGIGVNVNMSAAQCDSIDRPATSLRIQTGTTCDLAQSLAHLLPILDRTLAEWEATGVESVRKSWMQRAYRLHKEIEIVEDMRSRQGIFHDIGPNGELILDQNGMLRPILLGDVL